VKLAMRPGRQGCIEGGHAQMAVEAAGPMVGWREVTESLERVQILLAQVRRQALMGAHLATELAVKP
jgi:signal transduction protein with GAF and PtsI domain